MEQKTEKLAESFDREAVHYDENTRTFHHKISEYVLLNNLESELNNYANPRILDAGCGTGKIALKLLKKGFNITLLDISPKSLEIARNKIERENIRAEYYTASCEETPFENNKFDIVMLNGAVISYTPDPEKLLAEVNRILKRGGMIWFDFFNTVGWAMETTDLRLKYEIAVSENKLIQMPDWDYPARVMSLDYVRKTVRKNGFDIKAEYGLVNLTHTIDLDARYSDTVPEELVAEYQDAESAFSKNREMLGTAWSCIVCGIKK